MKFKPLLMILSICSCKGKIDSPEDLTKSIMDAVGDSEKMLELIPSDVQLNEMMTCESEKPLLERLKNQRAKMEDNKNKEAGFQLKFKSAEVLQEENIEKGGAIPFSMSKCKANMALTFAKINGVSDLIEKDKQTVKQTEFSAVKMKDQWLLFLLPSSK